MDFSYLDDWLDEEEQAEPAVPEVGDGHRNIWVLAELCEGRLLPATLEALGQARGLADRIGVYVYAVLIGSEAEDLCTTLTEYGADRVLIAGAPGLEEYQPDVWSSILADLVERYRPEILLLAGTSLGNDLAPRLAQRLETGLMSHCVRIDLDMSERLLIGTSRVMGGEVLHTFACPHARPQMASLEPGYFSLPYPESGRYGSVDRVAIDLPEASRMIEWLNLDQSFDVPAVALPGAKIVVAAGRGMKDEEGFSLVTQLAKALGGMVAGTRGAFDEGWIGEEAIVGVAGSCISPDLYVACGVSGDIYHSFGIQEAKFIVAINEDEDAPIMQKANMAIVGDARLVIPAMLEALD